ncbi:DEAD/DEAH box helicase family protein [Acinetobacter baumannii]|uniref:DEAD/DEAH box helicase family protein n=2 Tax=Acinetobacter baumannii TaxID=470 RepID=UPI000D65AE59|nr:DEAD/DEAH box helicase family protein [Acinetobacter baumannii]EHU1614661.1 DEAD/DEAH box helicase family protein [Acinetobacter baumannii]EHU2311741.1 DEAD/DEAH box helicase family protein [Acinetobacter baumannii]EHU2520754.1 DEAD/DEAH box helicase family protein [Acinetobacter baumannii]MEE1854190.1 restriction endonuclease [Acinetobacter baumannii]HBI1351423.1 DEAD/DEAH box helicase family protein [Acinetobacter baumannii]
MARSPSTASINLLADQLKKFDEPGLFGLNYQLPEYLKANLKDNLRPYQEEALRYFHYSQFKKEIADRDYKHLLFNMATGSGKTMVMAGAILYMFKEYGYQNFIFFVHTDAIIQKTKENLLNALSSKYLFTQPLEIEGERIYIEAVDIFPRQPSKNTIYLKLSTIHKIHDELNSNKENSITYDDLAEIPLVLLGDEAHHFNAETKAKGKSKTSTEYEELTWERTIENILALQDKNRLLEFTATINLDNRVIYQKYKDKIAYQYDLKKFMTDGFSKKVMLLEANQHDDEKMLDAVLLSQYRKLVAVKHGIQDFKPIILFKSNKIAISKAKQEQFTQIINDLTPQKVKTHLANKQNQITSSSSIWNRLISHYFTENLVEIVEGIQEDFNELNILNVNKSDILEEYPVLLNTLEEPDNPIRLIFAVAKVNEGWDVLNLYDIVRISESASSTKSGTDSEAQLIGRGARYYPFVLNGEKSFTRRFDLSNSDLSVLEQLHYHTINDPAYIKTLHTSLEQADIIADTDGKGVVEHAKLKSAFTNSDFYKFGQLFFNEVEEISAHERSWTSYSLEKQYEISYKTANEVGLDNLAASSNTSLYTKTLELDLRYWFKAIQKIRFFEFANLKHYFPELLSINEFLTDSRYLGGLTVNVNLPNTLNLSDLLPHEKLQLIEIVLTRIAENIRRNYQKYRGTHRFISKPLKDVITDYSVHIDPNMMANQRITSEATIGKTWYAYDKAILNQLEHRLIKLLDMFMEKLRGKYDDIYVIRNDEKTTRFKLTEFNGVRGFMPDFIMLMRDKAAKDVYYQVFLEPKGDDRLIQDAWKECILAAINDPNLIIIDTDDNVRLVGIKFFADTRRQEFIQDFADKLFDGEQLEAQSLLI